MLKSLVVTYECARLSDSRTDGQASSP